MSVVPTRTLLFGGACAVGGAATALSLRSRPETPAPVVAAPAPFRPMPVEPTGRAVGMSPAELDAALASAFPGDETPGYL